MSSPQGGTPDSSFQERLNRMADRRAPIEAAKPEVDVLPEWKANIRYPAALVGAALLGMLAVFVARFVRFHLMGGTLAGDDPDFTMLIDGGIAAACSFLIFGMLRFEGHEFKAAQTFGIVAMIGLMHNFVHAAPGAFGLMFSKQWTEDIVTYSEPGSLYFRGFYFQVLPSGEEVADEPEERELPKVRRMG